MLLLLVSIALHGYIRLFIAEGGKKRRGFFFVLSFSDAGAAAPASYGTLLSSLLYSLTLRMSAVRWVSTGAVIGSLIGCRLWFCPMRALVTTQALAC